MNEANRLIDADLDATLRNSEASIERNASLLREGEEMLESSSAALSELYKAAFGEDQDFIANPERIQEFVDRQPAEARAEFEREAQAVRDELERDLPKREAAPIVRVRHDRVRV